MDKKHLVSVFMVMLVSVLSALAVFCGQAWVIPFIQAPVVVCLIKAQR